MVVQIRDPVYNFISLREKELKLLGIKALQRLRGIRQLALAALVYPGAVHTRFDHTLGVTHVAGMMADALGFDEDEKELVRLAALLHDIGHGPFSHVSEYALERYADRGTLGPDQKKEKIHELVTALMIKNDPQIIRILGQDTCDNVARLLTSGYGKPVLRSVVSGPLDADKQDYLLRDSLFCGVQYGVFDKHQLHRSFVAHGEKNEEELMIKQDGVHAVEQYVLAKYYLTTNVYRHKVRLITDQMIHRAIILGVEKDEIEEIKKLFTFDNTPDFAERYALWDDSKFIHTFTANDINSKCKAMLTRLRKRKLLKRIFKAKPTDFKADVRESLLYLVKKSRDIIREKIETAIADKVGQEIGQDVDPDFVIYYAFDIKSVKEMSRNDEASILVVNGTKPEDFETVSNLFASIQEGFNEVFVEVYAPVAWESLSDRERICRNLNEPIKEIITNNCSNIDQANQGDETCGPTISSN